MPVVVVDASAGVELILATEVGKAAVARIAGNDPVTAAHFDAEVLSALGRLARASEIAEEAVEGALARLARAPFARYPLAPLLAEAWSLRANVTLRDGLYVALARRLGAVLLTTDARLARAPRLPVQVVVAGGG